MYGCQCLYEIENNLPRTKFCFVPCHAQRMQLNQMKAMENTILEQKIEKYLGGKVIKSKLNNEDVTIQDIIDSLQQTKSGFGLEKSLEELWEQEKDYYKNNGMNAFDSGYVGLNEDGTKSR